MQLDITIHDIVNEPDGITFIEQNGGRVTIPLTDWERELLRERLQDKVNLSPYHASLSICRTRAIEGQASAGDENIM